MTDRLSAATTMAPERWAAIHGVAVVADHLTCSAPPDAPSRDVLVWLIWLLNDPALRAYETLRAEWKLEENPPYQRATALADLAAHNSLALWAARYLRAEIETALEPLTGSVTAEWTRRAIAVLDEPGLLDHARRSLLTAEEQVAVAYDLVSEKERRPADGHDEQRVLGMRSEAATPEEWVARYGHTLSFGHMFHFRYADPVTDRWLARVYAINRSHETTNLLRQQILTPEEWAAIQAHVHSDDYEL